MLDPVGGTTPPLEAFVWGSSLPSLQPISTTETSRPNWLFNNQSLSSLDVLSDVLGSSPLIGTDWNITDRSEHKKENDLVNSSAQQFQHYKQMSALAASGRYPVQPAAGRRAYGSIGSPSSPMGQMGSPVAPSTPPVAAANGAAYSHPPKNPKLYKTELCRSWMDHGRCNYGERCQYAHGEHEKRPIPRHPKYKTEACQSFHQSGYCPYGPRCHFIHSEAELLSQLSRPVPQRVSSVPMPTSPLSSPLSSLLSSSPASSLLTQPVSAPPRPSYAYGSAGESPGSSTTDSGSESPIGSFSPGLDDESAGGYLPPASVAKRAGSAQKMESLINDVVAWTFDEKDAGGRLPVFAQLSNASSQ